MFFCLSFVPKARCPLAAAGLLGALLAGPATQAQTQPAQPTGPLADSLASYGRHALVEKLYVHYDRPTYAAGEAVWLKVYAVDGTTHRPLALSAVAYVEVLDAAKHSVAQASLTLRGGQGQGTLELPPDLPTGRYLLRAYTSWMRNFGPEYFFQSTFAVLNTFAPSGTAPAAKAPGYDVQFFAEGGQLVQGIAGRVAFKVLDQQGRGVAATGIVADAQGRRVASFSTLRLGMGSFELPAAPAGTAYVATVQLPGGATARVPLPAVQAQGYTLRLRDTDPAAVQLTVQTPPAAAPDGTPVQVLAHAGQHVVALLSGQLHGGQVGFRVPRAQLPEGITHFTVFDAARRPVAERLYFRPVRHALAIAAQADQASYAPRRPVRVQLATPTAASLSLAVYRLDSLATERPADMAAVLLLTSDLRGYVESPNSYLRDTSAVGREAADNLLLTQGWSRFSWVDVLAGRHPDTREYAPELRGPRLRVHLRTAAGQPAPPGTGAYLTMPSRTGRFYYATAGANGLVQFDIDPFSGPRQVIVQTDPRRDSTYRAELLGPYSVRYASPPLPPLALGAPLTTDLTERHVQAQVQQAFAAPAPPPTPAVADTASFFGKPSERYLLDNYTRFKVMEEVMREYVPGVLVRKRKDEFHFLVLNRPKQATSYQEAIFRDDPLTLLDGLPIFRTSEILAFDPLKVRQLDVVTARYFQYPLAFDGVVSYTTYKGDLGGFPVPARALIEEVEGPQVPREFYAPRYETAEQQHSRLPDLRQLLYWNPSIGTQLGQPQALDFYTSDQAGRYLLVVQGLGHDGQPGTTTLTFDVKPTL